MGDKYFIKLDCVYCGKKNPKPCDTEIWEDDYIMYAESCGYTDFKCGYCGKKNKIVQTFVAKK